MSGGRTHRPVEAEQSPWRISFGVGAEVGEELGAVWAFLVEVRVGGSWRCEWGPRVPLLRSLSTSALKCLPRPDSLAKVLGQHGHSNCSSTVAGGGGGGGEGGGEAGDGAAISIELEGVGCGRGGGEGRGG